MDVVIWSVLAIVIGSLLGHAACALAYASVFWRMRAPSTPPDARWPKYAIGIPLRGADPSLADALRSLLAQDYPDFEIRIIIDDENDPSWPIAREIMKNLDADRIHVEMLRERCDTCSRYASSLAQYLDSLDDAIQLVAFADADMIVPRDWLRNMALALADPAVGGTLGNRWYLPESSRWGSLVRYAYNAGAAPAMWLCEMPWTGALSLRLRDVRRSGLVDKLRHGMTEDTPVKDALADLGLRMRFVPQLIIPNREEISLTGCYHFIERQIMWTRLYHSHWPWVLVYATWGTLALFGPLTVMLGALLTSHWRGAALFGLCAAGCLLGLAGLMGIVAWGNRRALRANGERLTRPTLRFIARALVAIPLAQLFFLVSAWRCQFLREITWRGVRYEIRGPWDIRVIGEQPVAPAADHRTSI